MYLPDEIYLKHKGKAEDEYKIAIAKEKLEAVRSHFTDLPKLYEQ
jgi:hypothetical protein